MHAFPDKIWFFIYSKTISVKSIVPTDLLNSFVDIFFSFHQKFNVLKIVELNNSILDNKKHKYISGVQTETQRRFCKTQQDHKCQIYINPSHHKLWQGS